MIIGLLFVAFVATVWGANWSLAEFGMVNIGFGYSAPAGVFFAGIAFTLRDALHELGNKWWVIGAILLGAGLSFLLEDAQKFAIASGVAFMVSEMADLAIYTPLRKRGWLKAVAASNVVGFTVDSILFLYLAFGSLAFLEGQLVGKGYMTVGAIALLWLIRRDYTGGNMATRDTGDSEAIEVAMNTIAPLNVPAAESVLKEAKEIMDELGVTFFLRQGTCLGAIRDNAILAWDDDIDIGSIIGLNGLTKDSMDATVERVVTAFTARGFSTRLEQTSSYLYVLLLKSSVRIDWECFYVIDGTITHWPPKRFPVELFTELKVIDFLGQKHHVPNPPEDYLATKYGPEWRTPKKSGSYEKDVLAMIPDGPTPNAIQRLFNGIRALLSPRKSTTLQVLDLQGNPVAGAEVHVAGTKSSWTDSQGNVFLKLSDEIYHSFIIRFNDHEEVLYIERLTWGEGYVYRPDSQVTSGRSFALVEK